MVIDIDGHTLHASYLDSDGQTRDHFQINKVPEESPAIDWWQDHFGPSSYPYFADWFSDPDHDTHDNHSEFVLGGDPHQNQSLIEATIKKEEIGAEEFTEWFSIEYDLREGSDVTIETSENLIHFSTSGIETLRLTEPNAQGISRLGITGLPTKSENPLLPPRSLSLDSSEEENPLTKIHAPSSLLNLRPALLKKPPVLRHPPTHPLPPTPKARRLQTPPHYLDHLRLTKSRPPLDLIESRPVFPSHPDNLIAAVPLSSSSPPIALI